jgi:hypothetical protein
VTQEVLDTLRPRSSEIQMRQEDEGLRVVVGFESRPAASETRC